MKATIILEPLKRAKQLRVFALAAAVIAVVYVTFSVLIGIISLRPFPSGGIVNIILFGALRSLSTLTMYEWALLAMFPVAGGLLFANYSYWRCPTTRTGKAGLFAGLLAATCPICIFPVIGIALLSTSLIIVTKVVKVVGLVLIISATYAVALKQKKCRISIER